LRLLNDEHTIPPASTKPIVLPSLKVLGISPTHQQISNILQLPALQTAIFYSASSPFHSSDKLLDSFASLIENATKLHIQGWPKPSDTFPDNSASAFAIEILRRSTKFKNAFFSSSFLDCSPLHEYLPHLVEQGIGSGATIEEMHFVDCTGMTERDRERLSNSSAKSVVLKFGPFSCVVNGQREISRNGNREPAMTPRDRINVAQTIMQNQLDDTPSIEEIQLLQLAATDIKKELEVLQRNNFQAHSEKVRITDAIEELGQTLETAQKFKVAQELYVGTRGMRGRGLSTVDRRMEALRQLSREESVRRARLSAEVEGIEKELKFRRLALEVIQETISSQELLSQVFRHRVSQDVDDYLDKILDDLPPSTLILSHVCRTWRLVANSNPSLWCDIQAYTEERWNKDRIEIFNHYLHRAEGYPIQIYVELEKKIEGSRLRNFKIDNLSNEYHVHFVIQPSLGTSYELSELPYQLMRPKS
ncbi:13798_t:CDS:2, partial [Acaulospora colombiana]